MESCLFLQETLGCFFPILMIAFVWDFVWKVIGLWKSARNNDLAWFICIAVINSIGILPIIYILMNKKREE